MKSNPPTRHHYLPRFYVRRWAAAGEVFRYQRRPNGDLEVKRKPPSAVAFENDLYKMPGVVGERAQEIESKFMSAIDNAAAPLLEQLIRGQVPKNSQDRSHWSRFLLSLIHRTPKNVLAAKSALPFVCKSMYPAEESDPTHTAFLGVTSLINRIDSVKIGSVLNSMNWDVLDLDRADRDLLTSDEPIILSNGLKPPEGNYALPLAPNRLFVASWGFPYRDNLLRLSPRKIVSRSNLLVVQRASKIVIARRNDQRQFIDRHLSTEKVLSPVEILLAKYQSEQSA